MAMIMAFFMLEQNLNIIINATDYKPTILKIDSISCTGIEESTSQFCRGHGYIDGVLTSLSLGDDFDVDFNRDYYPVFYRPDGKLTLIRSENEFTFDNTPYLKSAMLQLGIPLVTILILTAFYRKLAKKIKRYEQGKTS